MGGVEQRAYLERLGIPVPHATDGGHLIEAIGQLVELLHAMCQADG